MGKNKSKNKKQKVQDNKQYLKKVITIDKSKEAEPTIVVPDEIMTKIRYICGKIPSDEWIGYIFYDLKEGSIDDPDNIKIEIVDILPLKIGSSASVDTDLTRDRKSEEILMNTYEKKENLEDYRRGLIHSHCDMSVYYSGTDMSEIEESVPNYDMYLSVVVNNKGDVCGRIAIYGEDESSYTIVKSTKRKIKNGMGILQSIGIQKPSREEGSTIQPIVIYYDAYIEKTEEEFGDSFLEETVKSLIEEKKKPKTTYWGGAGHPNYGDYSGYGSSYYGHSDPYSRTIPGFGSSPTIGHTQPKTHKQYNSFDDYLEIEKGHTRVDNEEDYAEYEWDIDNGLLIREFLSYCLNNGSPGISFNSTVDRWSGLKHPNLTMLLKDKFKGLKATVAKFFSIKKMELNDGEKLDFLDSCIQELEELENTLYKQKGDTYDQRTTVKEIANAIESQLRSIT